MQKPQKNGAKRPNKPLSVTFLIIITFLLFAAGCALSVRISFLQHIADNGRLRDRITLEIDRVRNNISRELYANISLSMGLADLVQIQGGINHAQFNALARKLKGHSGLIRNIALAPDNVIRFIYPLAGNEKALGLDYSRVPDQYAAVQRAIAEKRTVIAGPLRLVQGGTGIIGRTPIFLKDNSGGENKARYWGMASTVIDFNSLLQSAGIDAADADLRIAIRGIDGTGPLGKIFRGEEKVFASNPVTLNIPLPSGSWQIAAEPHNGWPPFRPLTSLPFLAGFFISLVLSILLFQTLYISRARAFEIKRRRLTEAALWQKNRALRLYSQCNSAVVYAADELSLLSEICRLAVNSAGYKMAWVGRAENDGMKTVKPVTYAGSGEGFLDKITVSWGDNEYGGGTAGTAIRTRRPAISRDILNNPNFAVWHEALKTRDYESAIAIPLITDDTVFGVLLIYAAEPDAFDSTEADLLESIGGDISHGMTAIRSKKERDRALAELEHERNDLEDRVAERTRELLKAKEMAESADRLKSAFLATMSHELRTPLNSIIGFTGILMQEHPGPLNEEQKKQIGMVQQSSRHLLSLINDILDISKIEAGQLKVKLEPFDLPEVIYKVVELSGPLAKKKNLKINVSIAPEVKTITSDRLRVRQILLNLVNNSIKFTEAGSITIECAAVKKSVLIKVADTGIGIEKKEIGRLFKPFIQIDTGLSRKHEGTGLGLSICKKLLDLLSGSIEVKSRFGSGSVFSVKLPV